jgi:hypothetical protein
MIMILTESDEVSDAQVHEWHREVDGLLPLVVAMHAYLMPMFMKGMEYLMPVFMKGAWST